MRDRRGHRLKAGSYVFDPDFTRDVIIKWEGDTDVVHGVEPCAHLSPALDRWAHDPRFLEPMCDFVGSDDPILFTEKLNLKRPQRGGVNPLHQDYPYWVGRRRGSRRGSRRRCSSSTTRRSTTAACASCPAATRRACGRRRTDGDEFAGNEIDARRLRRRRVGAASRCRPGSVVMFGSYLVHHSQPNTSSQPRRALLFSYQPPGAPHMLESLRRLGAALPLS